MAFDTWEEALLKPKKSACRLLMERSGAMWQSSTWPPIRITLHPLSRFTIWHHRLVGLLTRSRCTPFQIKTVTRSSKSGFWILERTLAVVFSQSTVSVKHPMNSSRLATTRSIRCNITIRSLRNSNDIASKFTMENSGAKLQQARFAR